MTLSWVAFDLETTGLPRSSRPVEIGARRFDADGRVWDFTTLVNPGIPIPWMVQQIHGISDAMVADAPDVKTAIERFLAFVDGAPVVAHNARFDAGILGYNAWREGVALPSVPVHDSLRIARRLLPHLWSYRLSHLAGVLKIADSGFHRALPDAVALGGVMRRLLDLQPRSLMGFPLVSDGFVGSLSEFRVGDVSKPGQAPRRESVLATSP